MSLELARSAECNLILAAFPHKTLVRCRAHSTLFHKGEPADSVYYIQSGRLKISRLSEAGREAIIALVSPGDFVGEGCLIGQRARLADAICIADSALLRIAKADLVGALRSNSVFARRFHGLPVEP
jgi:CRP/FNR family cyclic AMP-dependent transcriptional regulator